MSMPRLGFIHVESPTLLQELITLYATEHIGLVCSCGDWGRFQSGLDTIVNAIDTKSHLFLLQTYVHNNIASGSCSLYDAFVHVVDSQTPLMWEASQKSWVIAAKQVELIESCGGTVDYKAAGTYLENEWNSAPEGS